jgi:hypothetical protein
MVVDVDGSAGNVEAQTLRLPARVVEDCGDQPEVEGVPGCKVRQQTRDATASLLECSKFASQWVVLVEDDTELCSGGLQIMDSSLKRLASKKMNSVKFAKSFSGTAFPVSQLKNFTTHAVANILTEPIDWSVWWLDNGANVVGHNKNLFHHVGVVSTFGYRNSKAYLDLYGKSREDECFTALN